MHYLGPILADQYGYLAIWAILRQYQRYQYELWPPMVHVTRLHLSPFSYTKLTILPHFKACFPPMQILAGTWAGFKNLYDYNYDGGYLKSNEYICYLQVGHNFIAMVL